MARVQVVQRNARVAVPVECEFVQTALGSVARARLVVVSHHARRSAEVGDVERTSIRWTVWGRLAETAGRTLVVGSHLNVVGRMCSTRYQDRDGREVFDFDFTAEQIDFLETKQAAQARREQRAAVTASVGANASSAAGGAAQ